MNTGGILPFDTDSSLQQFMKISHFLLCSLKLVFSFCKEHDDTWQTSMKSVRGNFSNILFLNANENIIHLCCELYLIIS